MSQDNELRRLEQFVEKLLARFSELRTEKAKLQQELREREAQIEELRTTLSSKDMERSEISQRVSKIVEQIEEWESGLAESFVAAAETAAAVVVEADEEIPEVRKSLSEPRVEDEGRVQHNLFSLGNPQR